MQIRSKAKPMCIDSPADHHNYHKPVNMWPCHNQGGNQVSSCNTMSIFPAANNCTHLQNVFVTATSKSK